MHDRLKSAETRRVHPEKSSNRGVLLRGRYVLPTPGNVIEDGALFVHQGRVAAAGLWKHLAAEHSQATTIDLGDVVILPGLVNAHCHLDYTAMAGYFPPQKSFSDWIKLIKETKLGWDKGDYLQSWVKGARMLVNTGTTTVGDIEAVPELLPKAWKTTPLKVISFLEMIGLSPARSPSEVLGSALSVARRMRKHVARLGLSPHAPYSTTPELLRLTADEASRRGWRIAIHAAESEPEYHMFRKARGELHDWIARSGRPMQDCALRQSPIRHVINSGLAGDNVMMVHANYLARGDATELAARGIHVVHCPRSHEYFRHRRSPLRSLLKAGVNVALGTDSLASVYRRRGQTVQLSMFAEMRTLHAAHSWLRPGRLLEMATRNGALALGQENQIGKLAPGFCADLICLSFTGKKSQLFETILEHRGTVRGSMIGGKWVIRPPNAR